MNERSDALSAFPVLDDRYRVEQLLGSGGFGDVWMAHDQELDRPVAVKVMRAKAKSTLEAERWRTEAKALASIHHASVVGIHDFAVSTDGDAAVLILSWIDGEPLAARLSRGKIEERQALAWFHDLADGLAALHRAGLVHRDLKPENILIEKASGRPVIIDLGAAIRCETDWALRLTRTTDSIGSAGYMAPEQMQPGYQPDPATDQFALAVVLYQMLAGHLPSGRFETLDAIGLLAEGSSRAVNRALATSPADRFPSVEAFAAALKKPNSKPPLRVALILGLVLVAGAGVYSARSGRPPRPVAPPGPTSPLEDRRAIDRFHLKAETPSSIFRLDAGADGHLVVAGSLGGMMSCAGWRDGPQPSWIRPPVPEAYGGVACDLSMLARGDLVMAGWIDGGAEVWRDFVVSKVDRTTGVIHWLFRKEGGLGRNDMAHGVAVSPDGTRLAAAGFVHGGRDRKLRAHVVLLDVDDGSVIWETDPDREGGDSVATSIRFLPEGDLVITGQMIVQDRMYEAFVSRLDGTTGDFRWTRSYGSEENLTNDIALAAESGREGRLLVLSACGVHEGGGHPTLACLDPDEGSIVWLKRHEEGMPTGFVVGQGHLLVTRTRTLADGRWETICTASDPESGGTRNTWTLARGTGTPMASDVAIDAQGTCWIAAGTAAGTVVVRRLGRGKDLETVLEIADLAWPLQEAEWHEGFLLRRRMLAANGSLWLAGPRSTSVDSELQLVRLGPAQR